ncbi:Sugar phosphate phosphatase [Aphelenchoides besseyi]|nr:Sugar phosphate phosphatase [Aphelenchoides besseyi]KAI6199728.1 Sugar phosphate phosphatase [Aphelenchoides besseyi]
MVVDAPQSCGAIKPSFAYTTITERWPKIITRVIDQMHQKHNESVKQYGESGDADIKYVIHNLSRLRYMVVTDKPLEFLVTDLPDKEVWNKVIKDYHEKVGEKETTWYKIPFLFSECFMYRWIYQYYQNTQNFKDYDPFRLEKEKSYHESRNHLLTLAHELLKTIKEETKGDELKKEISRLLQVCLWGNKADLSLSGGDSSSMSETLFKELDDMRGNILVDHIDVTIEHLMNLSAERRVDFILDNSGLELFTDLCLGELLVTEKLASKVVFHGKDFNWVINTTANSEDSDLKELGKRWQSNVEKGLFEYKTHEFFTFGFSYFEIPTRAPELYADLQKSSLLIFKGDLNGRKLIGDRDWTPTTPFLNAIKDFKPTNFILLRTLKAETVAGLSEETYKKIVEKFGREDRTWQVSSDYAVAQAFFKKDVQ